MANLPSNTFLFNYNAKEYNPTTYTFPKTYGQLFDEDLVLNKAPSSYNEDSVTFGSSQAYFGKIYNSTSENPFNVNASNHNFTFIYKTSGWSSDDTNILANRNNSTFNFMMRGNRCIFGTEYCIFSASNNPQYVAITVDSNGTIIRKELDGNGNTIQSATTAATYSADTTAIGFFSGYGSKGAEYFTKTFYWMYCSRETLTDSEILQVIKYNEGIADNLSISKEEMSFSYSGGTDSLVVSSLENTWSASTNDNWISVSPSTGGTGDTTVTITVNPYLDTRTGSVTFTDGTDSVTLSISQSTSPSIKIDNLYCNGSKVKQLILNKVIVHRNLEDISQ